ncbi:IucA/IucC family C-terminal-domain containing protein [Alkalihalophilus lindianensis]|uniref:IucA/IucC family C-terminal-domain containing protein n=1 Tax=Alkalihalophilus lindianensis TaxID=1630542 RepID=A0ABU3XE88_9BACI|nr:IucA/IucC family C-terminal-domain containing protein [Alkalihalophilus lindianensis]MDV2686197.1 IucA/IucC family C-terminal-domain containing protein [Alkalihalophilus lindianensis]
MVHTKLLADEVSALQSTRLTVDLNQTHPLSCAVRKLFDEEFLIHYLESVRKEVNAPDLLVAASMFSKRYSLIITLPALLMMTVYNKRLAWSKDDLHLSDSASEQWWLPSIHIAQLNYEEIKKGEEGSRQIETLFTQLFAEHLTPLWQLLHKQTGIPTATLWENAFAYIKWFYHTVLPEKADPTRVQEDFQWIGQASGDLFGLRKNPFAPFYQEQKQEGRLTCCFAYKCSADKVMCTSCPKMK